MLGKRNAVANLAVKDLDRARAFYTETLGLEQVDNEGDELVVLKSGDTVLNVYRSDYAGTNEATAVTWAVDDIDAEVAALKGKGIFFEHYDMPGLDARGRRPCRRRHEDRLVQGPGRQHPQHRRDMRSAYRIGVIPANAESLSCRRLKKCDSSVAGMTRACRAARRTGRRHARRPRASPTAARAATSSRAGPHPWLRGPGRPRRQA